MAVTGVSIQFACVKATDIQGSITLDPDREFTIVHTGLQTDASTSDTAIIYLYTVTYDEDDEPTETVASITADLSEELYKYPLTADEAVVVGPNVATLYFKTASGSPVFSVLPSPSKFGRY